MPPVPGTNARLSRAARWGPTQLPAHALPQRIPTRRRTWLCSHLWLSHPSNACSEKASVFAASRRCSLNANVTGLPGTHVNPDTHKPLCPSRSYFTLPELELDAVPLQFVFQ